VCLDGVCAVQLATCESPIGRLGLTVCYDLRFPELYQRLAFDLGAQVLLVPSAFTKMTGLYQSCIIKKMKSSLLITAKGV
jgi:predicted amidohydrolase